MHTGRCLIRFRSCLRLGRGGTASHYSSHTQAGISGLLRKSEMAFSGVLCLSPTALQRCSALLRNTVNLGSSACNSTSPFQFSSLSKSRSFLLSQVSRCYRPRFMGHLAFHPSRQPCAKTDICPVASLNHSRLWDLPSKRHEGVIESG